MAKKDEEKAGVPAAVEPNKNSALAAYQYDADDLGGGFEHMDATHFAIPFLNVLQKNSPQVDEDHPRHIDGAKAGFIINSIDNRLFDGKEKGILFVPVHSEHKYLEYIPRDQGGGFVSTKEVTDPEVIKLREGGAFGKLINDAGNELVETFNVYGVLVDEETDQYDYVIVGMSSTQIKKYKNWMTMARSQMARAEGGRRVPLPLYGHVYQLKTVFQENKKGSWYGWDIGFKGGNALAARLEKESELFQTAKNFRAMVTSGVAKADYAGAGQDDNTTGEDEF